MTIVEIKVPDIGGMKAVPVIEVLVKPGDSIAKDQGLVTLESDKATMEVPSSMAGVLKELKVKVGDEVSEGQVIAVLESADASAAATPASPVVGGGASATKPAASDASSPQPSPGGRGEQTSAVSAAAPASGAKADIDC